MTDAALTLYHMLSTFPALEELVSEAEAESLHLECKAPSEPRLTRELRAHLGTAVSGFANTAGGIVIYGAGTTKHQHTGLDVITQIEPIGQCRRFQQAVAAAIPSLTTPPILGVQTKVITLNPRDNRGVLIVHVPHSSGDPVLCNLDNVFYFRTGDEFRPAPFEIVKRLFAATDSPDVYPVFRESLVKLQPDGTWSIPLTIENRSSAVARDVTITVTLLNPAACEQVTCPSTFRDSSGVNPGKQIYIASSDSIVHRGLHLSLGEFMFKMKVGKRPKRKLDLAIAIYADKMRARELRVSLKLAKKRFSVAGQTEKFLY
jgi:hypothetical protein